ncbi:MAG: Crp/Fnr family transcriptional regulator [Hyphomicrobiales bacterium]
MQPASTQDPILLASAQSLETNASAAPAIPDAVVERAATVRTRRGQSLALSYDGGAAAFVVRSGILALHVTLPEGLRQVVAILYPGDVVPSAFAPPHASAFLTAMSVGEVLRLRSKTFSELVATDSDVARYFQDAAARQAARQGIHLAAVGRFDCQQRVATYLTELALRIGVRAPGGGLTFEMPLSRTDLADYLGLNADTLSRTMSRLRASGLISFQDRQHAVVRDFVALAALTPAAQSLMALCGGKLSG